MTRRSSTESLIVPANLPHPSADQPCFASTTRKSLSPASAGPSSRFNLPQTLPLPGRSGGRFYSRNRRRSWPRCATSVPSISGLRPSPEVTQDANQLVERIDTYLNVFRTAESTVSTPGPDPDIKAFFDSLKIQQEKNPRPADRNRPPGPDPQSPRRSPRIRHPGTPTTAKPRGIYSRGHSKTGKKKAARLEVESQELLQLGVLRLGFFQDGNIAVSIFPEGEEILISRARFGASRIVVSAASRLCLKRIRAAETKMGKCGEHGVSLPGPGER